MTATLPPGRCPALAPEMCPNKRAQQARCPDLQHLPTPLLSAVFLRLDAATQAAFSCTCRALRTAGLHTLGRSLVRQVLPFC